MTPAGVLTTLVEFTGTGGGNRGSLSSSPLVRGSDGNFYGTTAQGGVNNLGTVFSVTPTGVLTTIVDFTGVDGAAPGNAPLGALVQGSDGRFYGTTSEGGASDIGTVFALTSGGVFTTLIDFTGSDGTRGTAPLAGLLQGGDGNLYGTTSEGGV